MRTIAENTENFPCQNTNDYQDLSQGSEALQWNVKNEVLEQPATTSVKNASKAIFADSSTSLPDQSVKNQEEFIIKSGNISRILS